MGMVNGVHASGLSHPCPAVICVYPCAASAPSSSLTHRCPAVSCVPPLCSKRAVIVTDPPLFEMGMVNGVHSNVTFEM
jgi:hypothetical protein